MTTAPLLVVQTYYVPSRGAGARYELHLAPALPPRAPRPLLPRHLCHHCTVLVTTDSVAYQDAVAAEGTTRRCVATWHLEGRTAVLDELEVRR
jgi:hypothetical protein